MDLTLMWMGLGLIVAAGVTAWGVGELKKPKHYFRAWQGDYEWNTRLKKIGASHDWTDPKDKSVVRFNLNTAYAKKDPKTGALKFIGDTETGALMKGVHADKTNPAQVKALEDHAARIGGLIEWQNNGFAWIYENPKTIHKKLTDGRPQAIAKSMNEKPAPWYQPYVLPGAVIGFMMLGAILFFVYKMANAAKGG